MNLSSEFAALVTFKKLFDEKKDIYDVIEDFILFVIVYEGYRCFDSAQITADVNDEFQLDIPSSVIKESLKNMISKKYIVRDNKNGYESIISEELETFLKAQIDEYEKDKEHHEIIKKELLNYVSNKACISYNSPEEVYNIFRDYVLGIDSFIDHNRDLVSAVGTFILKEIEENPSLSCRWDLIKSSIIIKEGLIYNNDILSNNIKNLTLFLDMEVLFDGEGYNGKIYQDLFLSLMTYINKLRDKGCTLHLKFFDDTEDRINAYFNKALDIFDNRSSLQPETTAMIDIVTGCHNRSDIADKKSKFFHFLDVNKIKIDYARAYKSEIDKYPLSISNCTYKDEFDFESSSDTQFNYIYPLEYINILKRGSREKKISESKYIFVTRTKYLLDGADRERNSRNEVPLAVNLDYLINHFWVASGDGLGGQGGFSNTSSFVQRVLSDEKRKEIFKEYIKLKDNKDSLDDVLVKKRIAALRRIDSKPENMNSRSFDFGIDEEINEMLESKQNLSIEIHEHKQTKDMLEKEQIMSRRQKAKNRKTHNKLLKQKKYSKEKESENKQLKQLLDKSIDILKKDIDKLTNEQNKLDSIICNKYKNRLLFYRLLFILLSVSYIISTIIFVPKYWDVLEPVTWVLSSSVFVLGYLFLAIRKKTLNIKLIVELIAKKLHMNLTEKIYMRNNFNIQDITQKQEELNSLLSEYS